MSVCIQENLNFSMADRLNWFSCLFVCSLRVIFCCFFDTWCKKPSGVDLIFHLCNGEIALVDSLQFPLVEIRFINFQVLLS